jgi:hypothetical protein
MRQVAFGPQGGLQPGAPVVLPLELPVVPPVEVIPPEAVPPVVPPDVAPPDATPPDGAPPEAAPLAVPVFEAPAEELVPPLDPAQPTAANAPKTTRIAATLI